MKKGRNASPELAERAQQVLDDFVFENAWHARQQEIVRRWDRDGEVFLRLLRHVRRPNPRTVCRAGASGTPPGSAADPSSSFGILTEPDDVETALAYYVDGQAVDAAEIQHRKANVDANVKRGLPLYYPVRKNLRRTEKLLRNMSVVAEIPIGDCTDSQTSRRDPRGRGAIRRGTDGFTA